MKVHYSKKSALVILGIVASSSTAASSFGTGTSFTSIRSKVVSLDRATIHTRGGSDQTPAALSMSDASTPNDLEQENSQTDITTAVNWMGPNSTPPGLLRSTIPQFPWHRLPDLLTYARCIAIPGLVLQFYLSTSPDKNIHSKWGRRYHHS